MKQVQLKLKDDEAAAIDRVRGEVPRERWIRDLCAGAVVAHDGLAGVQAPVIDPKLLEAAAMGALGVGSVPRAPVPRRTAAQASRVIGHFEAANA